MARQVRLDEAVAYALLDEFGSDASLSAAANTALRDRYGLDGALPPAEPAQRPRAAPAGPGRASGPLRPPGRRVGRCRHPLERRVGPYCAGCGARVW